MLSVSSHVPATPLAFWTCQTKIEPPGRTTVGRDCIDTTWSVDDGSVLHLGGTSRRGDEWTVDVRIDDDASRRQVFEACERTITEEILSSSWAGDVLIQDMADSAGEAGDLDAVEVCNSLIERRDEGRTQAARVAGWLLCS